MEDRRTAEPDWEALGTALEREAELHAPTTETAAAWLEELLDTDTAGTTAVSRVLDVGSGPGVMSCLLARRFPRAEVVAVDQAAGLLERARRRAAAQGLTDRLRTLRAQLPHDLAALGSAELIWTGHAVHHLGDQQAALDALAAHLRPGGLLAVAERGLPLRFLPRDIGMGRPGLQARLDAAVEEAYAQMRADLPGSTAVVEDWSAMLSRAGLVPTGTRTFLTDRPAPLAPEARDLLHSLLSRLDDQLSPHLDAQDRATLTRLLAEDSPAGILRRPDAFYLTATTVHTARAC